MVGILSSSLTVGAELSNPLARYLSVSIMWSCRGTLRLVTSAPRLRFAFGKAWAAVTLVGRLKCSECPSSSHPPPFTLLVFVPLLGNSYTHPPPSHPLSWHLTAPFLRLIFGRYTKTRLGYTRPWPSLMVLWHTLRRPLTRVASTHYPILPSGTASSPGTAPVCRSILSLPSSG